MEKKNKFTSGSEPFSIEINGIIKHMHAYKLMIAGDAFIFPLPLTKRSY